MVCDKKLLRTLAGEVAGRPPFWFMRQAGRYLPEYRKLRAKAGSFLDLVYDPVQAAEITLQPVRRFGTDAAILFSDILVVPHALGQKLDFVEGEGPRLEAVRSTGDLEQLSASAATERLAPIFETVRLVREGLPEHAALIGFAGGLWTVASYMVAGRGGDEQRAAKLWAYRDPEGFGRLMTLLEDATLDYLLAQVAAGAEVLQIFDSWAGSLPEPWFESLVITPTRSLVARLRAAAPQIPVIGFPRGGGALLERYAAQTGVHAVSLDSSIPLSRAHRELPAGFPVQGNLDPALVVAGGRVMCEEAERICSSFEGRPHIFNLGHGFTPDTPPEHVARLCELLRGADKQEERA